MLNRYALQLLSLSIAAGISCTWCAGQVVPAPTAAVNTTAGPVAAAQPELPPQKPPTPPKVICNGDQLTVVADNSTLESVLAAIRSCTGVKIDIPAEATNSRTFDKLGPGPAREILTSLLSGTDFNYVIESSASDPQKVEGVLLLAKSSETPAGTADDSFVKTPGRSAWKLFQRTGRPVYKEPDGLPTATGVQNTVPVEDVPPDAVENPGSSPDAAPASGDAAPPADSSGAATQNSAEIPADSSATGNQQNAITNQINNMEKLFEQRRQMQQNQSTPPQPQ